MSTIGWLAVICSSLSIVLSLLSIHWARRAVRDYRAAAEIYRRMP